MPAPSSLTAMLVRPPSTTSTTIARAPASRLFSTSSLTTEMGRSMTSPAAICAMVAASSWRMARGCMRSGASPVARAYLVWRNLGRAEARPLHTDRERVADRQLHVVAPRLLGRIERRVSRLHELLFRRDVLRIARHADRHGDLRRRRLELEFVALDGLAQPARHHGGLGLDRLRHEHDELVAAVTAADVDLARVLAQHVAELLEQFVALRMAVRIVDVL